MSTKITVDLGSNIPSNNSLVTQIGDSLDSCGSRILSNQSFTSDQKSVLIKAHGFCHTLCNFTSVKDAIEVLTFLKSELAKINEKFLNTWLNNLSNSSKFSLLDKFAQVHNFIELQGKMFHYLNSKIKTTFKDLPLTSLVEDQFFSLFKQNPVTLRNEIFNNISNLSPTQKKSFTKIFLNFLQKNPLKMSEFFNITSQAIIRKINTLTNSSTSKMPKLELLTNANSFSMIFSHLDFFSLFFDVSKSTNLLIASINLTSNESADSLYQEFSENQSKLKFINLLITNINQNLKLVKDSQLNIYKILNPTTDKVNDNENNLSKNEIEEHFVWYSKMVNSVSSKLNENLLLLKNQILKEYTNKCQEELLKTNLTNLGNYFNLVDNINSDFSEVSEYLESINKIENALFPILSKHNKNFSKLLLKDLVINFKTINKPKLLAKLTKVFSISKFFITDKDLIELIYLSFFICSFVFNKKIENNFAAQIWALIRDNTTNLKNYSKILENSVQKIFVLDENKKINKIYVELNLMKKLKSINSDFCVKIEENFLTEILETKSYKEHFFPLMVIKTKNLILLNFQYNLLKKIYKEKSKQKDLNYLEKMALEVFIKGGIVEEVGLNFEIVKDCSDKTGNLAVDFLVEYIYRENKNLEQEKVEVKKEINSLLVDKVTFFVDEVQDSDVEWNYKNVKNLVMQKFKLNEGECDDVFSRMEVNSYWCIDKENNEIILM